VGVDVEVEQAWMACIVDVVACVGVDIEGRDRVAVRRLETGDVFVVVVGGAWPRVWLACPFPFALAWLVAWLASLLPFLERARLPF